MRKPRAGVTHACFLEAAKNTSQKEAEDLGSLPGWEAAMSPPNDCLRHQRIGEWDTKNCLCMHSFLPTPDHERLSGPGSLLNPVLSSGQPPMLGWLTFQMTPEASFPPLAAGTTHCLTVSQSRRTGSFICSYL